MVTETAAQALQRNIESMGEELGPIYSALVHELLWLHWRWEEFRALFGRSQERIDILNQSAGAFFFVIQEVLWADILLGIARITDSQQSGGRKNLTVQALPSYLGGHPICSTVVQAVQTAIERATFAKDWRNRHLAHADLQRAVEGREAHPLAVASRERVAEALEALAHALNIVDEHFNDATLHYDLANAPGDANSMVRMLYLGIRAQERFLERLGTNEITPEELEEWRGAV